jgi:hypothetical protein
MWHSCDEKLITKFDSDKQLGLVDLIAWCWRIKQNYAERGDASNVFCPQTLPFFLSHLKHTDILPETNVYHNTIHKSTDKIHPRTGHEDPMGNRGTVPLLP